MDDKEAEVSEFRTQEEIGGVLREFRDEAGLTQGDVAALLDVDQATVSRIESGARALTARELVVLADEYAVSADSILRREEVPVLLRAGDSASEGTRRSLDAFRECIEDYLGLASMRL
jgi:transcriptional regulator with XRE-family HTH domain